MYIYGEQYRNDAILENEQFGTKPILHLWCTNNIFMDSKLFVSLNGKGGCK